MKPKRTRGEKLEEVRKRIERWKERVERAQSNTIFSMLAEPIHTYISCEEAKRSLHTKEDILEDDGLLRQPQEIRIIRSDCCGAGGGLLLNPCPGQVDVE